MELTQGIALNNGKNLLHPLAHKFGNWSFSWL